MIVQETGDLVNEIDSYYRSILITGLRGTGKSSLLARIREGVSKSEGVITLDISAKKNVSTIDLVVDTIQYAVANKNAFSKVVTQIKNISGAVRICADTPIMDASIEMSSENGRTVYKTESMQLRRGIDQLRPMENLILITIDEAQNDPEGVASIISCYQVLQSLGYKIALMVAGLPQLVDELFNNEDITFYRRVNHIAFNLSNDPDIVSELDYERDARQQFIDIFEGNGHLFNSSGIARLARISFDYLFLFQALGYSLWQHLARVEKIEIGPDDVEQALTKAKQILFSRGYRQIWAELTPKQRAYMLGIASMANDLGVTSTGEYPEWTNMNYSHCPMVQQQMIDLGHIEKQGVREVRFALPYFWEFVVRQRL
jgi:AAA+ ATPase superfamily predicted ATPase